ncbi:MAG: aspartate-alanine antiporter [Alphaproteobacteria bacterium]|nr:aspartate-alanine antiporter [Alphaproteobacteria bacterium]
MMWIASQPIGRSARIVALVLLTLGALCWTAVAHANTESAFDGPVHQIAAAAPAAPGVARDSTEAPLPLQLAQAQDEDEEAEEGEEAKEAAPTGPEPSQFWIVNTLRKNPMLVIFLTLAIGYWVGAIKLGNFSLGSVTGVLLTGVALGQLDVDISPHVKTMFFLFFLFAVGYGVGPQFVRGIARDGGPQAIFAVVICLLCLGTVYVAALIAGYGPGLAAGLLAGAQTISASIGLATDAIGNLGLSAEQARAELNYMPVAYAVCYIYGTVGTGWVLAFLGPKMLGVDLEAECARYEREMSAGAPASGAGTAWHQLSMRTFRVSANVVGKTVAEAEASVGEGENKVFIEAIRRGEELVEIEPTTKLKANDVVAVSGPTERLIEQISPIATEVADRELLEVPVESVDMVMTKKDYDGKTVMELAKEDFTRGVYLTKITRGAVSVDIPVLAKSQIYRGDILTLSGTKTHTDQIIKAMGYADRPSSMTDMVWVGIFVVIGGLLGAITVTIGGVPVTLSVSGGALIGGIVLGWLRAVRPIYGQVPAPSLWLMNSVGLNVFIAVVGISAGPTFIEGLKEAGVTLFLWGIVATSVPMLCAPWIGKYLFRFDPAINLGCCGGARTSTASVAMVADVAKSNVPMLGYTVPYAVSNTLLTLWGMVIVLMIGTGPGG